MESYSIDAYARVEKTLCEIMNALDIGLEQDISGYGSVGWLVMFLNAQRYDVYLHVSKTPVFPDEQVFNRLRGCRDSCHMEIFAGAISDQMRRYVAKEYPRHIVLDICNLLYMVRNRPELREKLVHVLEFSVDTFPLMAPDARLPLPAEGETSFPSDQSAHRLETGTQEDLEGLLLAWNPGKETSGDYEKLCCGALKKLFAEDLSLWQEQQKSNDGLFRFDMICKIKNGNQKDFWQTAERYFRSRYIVFEYKNYTGCVTQKEVYTTVKYLYGKALRGIGILISPNGPDEHAQKAIRGILREEGKLILTLTNQDLLTMLQWQRRGRVPADYLSEKLDEMLINLEK